MSNRFVRASKYRHVYGRSTRKEQCYDNLRVSRNAWDTNLVKANPKYLSVNWEASGGGAFAVIPIADRGRLPEHIPLFRGHTAVVLDTDWSPFDDSLVASASDDAKAFIWKVPADFRLRPHGDEELSDVAPTAKLTGHSRKVGHVLFNPAADRVLATSSGDFTIKIWDVEAGAPKLTLKQNDVVQDLSWSANGSLLVTTSRDKQLRIWDVRQEKPAHVEPGHAGAKASRVAWMGENDNIATTGFSRMSDRQLGLWDIRNPGQPMNGFERLDSISGVCIPFWDDGTQCIYLAGKGDGNIRYYEFTNGNLEYLAEYKSSEPQRGIAFLPKRGVNVHENEIMRGFKSVNDTYIEPISFIVPRRAEVFQEDIFPPATGSKPAMSGSDWFGGKEGLPPKIDLGAVYAGEEPREVASQPRKAASSPVKAPAEPAVKKSVEPELPTPTTAFKGPPPSMNEQTASIKTFANKYNDEEEDEADDASSFEEVAKPVDRSAPSTASRGLGSGLASVKDKPNDFDRASQVAASQSSETQIKSQSASTPAAAASDSTLPPSHSKTPSAGGHEVQASLVEIKHLLEQQNRAMSVQNDTITKLTAEVDRLKAKMDGS